MRFFLGLCALVACGSGASAQGGGDPGRPLPARSSASQPQGTLSTQGIDSVHLSRRQAISQALQNNPQVAVAREQMSQAYARRVEAIAVPDPIASATLGPSSGFFASGQAASAPISIWWDIPFPTKFGLKNKVALGDVGANESNYKVTRQQIAFQTSQAYDSLLLAYQHKANLTETHTLSLDFLKKTQARYAAGTVAKLDVIKAQVDGAQTENDLIANERDVRTAMASLNRLMGRGINSAVVPTDSLTPLPSLPDSTQVERIALMNRPEIGGLQSQQRAATANTKLLKEFWIPDIQLGLTTIYAFPGSPVFSTGLAMPVPLMPWFHTRGEIAESQHHERELAASYRDLHSLVAWEADSAYANASIAMRQVVFIRDELLPSTREAYRVASVSYGLGGSSALDVLQARRDLLAAENQYAEALTQASIALADLEFVLGGVPLESIGARQP